MTQNDFEMIQSDEEVSDLIFILISSFFRLFNLIGLGDQISVIVCLTMLNRK